MQTARPKHWETIDSFNNSNNAPEILSSVICLAKKLVITRSKEALTGLVVPPGTLHHRAWRG